MYDGGGKLLSEIEGINYVNSLTCLNVKGNDINFFKKNLRF